MAEPSSQHLAFHSGKAHSKRKERPEPLDLGEPALPGGVSLPSNHGNHTPGEHSGLEPPGPPSLQVSITSEPTTESDPEVPRSTSATSSLDPYYFMASSRNHSPTPPLPDSNLLSPDTGGSSVGSPFTPSKDPASIDRQGLIGVGDLATPRWGRMEDAVGMEPSLRRVVDEDNVDDNDEAGEVDLGTASDDDAPGSPWTIEAVDGEQEDLEKSNEMVPLSRVIRTRPSLAEESGGEEILYPRKTIPVEIPSSSAAEREPPISPSTPPPASPIVPLPTTTAASPPTSFVSPTRKAKKRTSDEFAMDQTGILISKTTGSSLTETASQSKGKEDKTSSRKHRSLGVGIPPPAPASREKLRDKRRPDDSSLQSTSPAKSNSNQSRGDKHSRHTSVSSSSSNQGDPHHSRRGRATTDFSHLPPSPSSSSIQQFLKLPINSPSSGGNLSDTAPPISGKEKDQHTSPNVAHSLLRGTQEGWSALDDEATAEALRKLDGISGKSARARGSIGSTSRTSSHSRPATPGMAKGSAHWEGVDGAERLSRRASGLSNKRESAATKDWETSGQASKPVADKESLGGVGLGLTTLEGPVPDDEEQVGGSLGTDESHVSPQVYDKGLRKSGSMSARSSFTPKRGSASSTNYTGTPTTSSRDSASLSITTNATSVSASSGRLSMGKMRRNSAGSDVSSVHSSEATTQRDRAALLAATGDGIDDNPVPPVPPLPKDLSHYKSPPQSSTSLVFPSIASVDDKDRERGKELEPFVPLDASVPGKFSPARDSTISQRQVPTPSQPAAGVPPTVKTPSKKWSLSALSLKRSVSPSSSSAHPASAVSPLNRRSMGFGKQIHKSASRELPHSPAMSSKASTGTWSPIQNGAMASATSLASMSSVGSVAESSSPTSPVPRLSVTSSRTPNRVASHRSEITSSASTNHTTGALHPVQPASSSPSKPRRESSTRRLTPSAIPFFRRSSSQSMQLPSGSISAVMSTSPTFSSAPNSSSHLSVNSGSSPTKSSSMVTPTTPSSAHKKSSMLSLGLPSLLKSSSSRKSLQADKSDSSSREPERMRRKDQDGDRQNERTKKDEKDRSESRISVLMGRKRGKTLSSTDQKKAKPITLPPIQMTAIPPTTAQRVANLKAPPLMSTSSSSSGTGAPRPATTTTPSRATSQTLSSMQKQSDASLRSSRHQLPTIAGSPSVGTTGRTSEIQSREPKEPPPPSSSFNTTTLSGGVKETPTKIPRIASRSSGVTSPQLKTSTSFLTSRRASLIVGPSNVPPAESAAQESDVLTNEFGVLDNGDSAASNSQANTSHRNAAPGSPSGGSRVSRQASVPAASTTTAGGLGPRKPARDSVAFTGLRKTSTGSVASMSSMVASDSHHRLSALSPSKGLNKLLSPKISLPTPRMSASATNPNMHQAFGSPSSSRQSLSTPSPIPSSVDEEEILGDEEMMQYIKRQQARKLANGAKREELDELLRFPEPQPPGRPSSPASLLNSNQAQYLSEYERKEILDYPSVYYIGERGDKKMAKPDNPTNNFGYDDERGDYLVINHDHLAFRYEIIDTLGKGSFGQVLHCRDHCSGASVAIKIIRNKKRFHHQALVEIKILENLCKWDPEERHHVIKMTEHFYFRNHLCIAMELLSINLYELIKANGFTGFTTTLIRRFTSQMLLSLSLMRHHRIVHCDLKPENVLLRHPAKSGIKVIDFGSSCFENEKVYTYIQSRFYRSPEVILGMNYNMAIDMWSLGCILAELYTGFPIFPGENEQEQLSCIMEVLGVPDKELINRSSRKKLFFDSTGTPRPVVNSKGRRRRPGTKTLVQVLRCDDELFVDFISKCLIWDPERRLKPQSALRHPFLTASRRSKPTNPSPAPTRSLLSSSSLSSSSRNKTLNETPKKSQISAPTPLTARGTRLHTTQAPSTPVGSSVHSTLGSSKSYRTSQPVSYHSSRSMNGFVAAAAT